MKNRTAFQRLLSILLLVCLLFAFSGCGEAAEHSSNESGNANDSEQSSNDSTGETSKPDANESGESEVDEGSQPDADESGESEVDEGSQPDADENNESNGSEASKPDSDKNNGSADSKPDSDKNSDSNDSDNRKPEENAASSYGELLILESENSVNTELCDDGYTGYSFAKNWENVNNAFGYSFEDSLNVQNNVRNPYRKERLVVFMKNFADDDIVAKYEQNSGECRFFEIKTLPDSDSAEQISDKDTVIKSAIDAVEAECDIDLLKYNQSVTEENGGLLLEFTQKHLGVIVERVTLKTDKYGKLVYFERDMLCDPNDMPESEADFISMCKAFLEKRNGDSSIDNIKLAEAPEGAYIQSTQQGAVKLTVSYTINGKESVAVLLCPYGKALDTDIRIYLTEVNSENELCFEKYVSEIEQRPVPITQADVKKYITVSLNGKTIQLKENTHHSDGTVLYMSTGDTPVRLDYDNATGEVVQCELWPGPEYGYPIYEDEVDEYTGYERALKTMKELCPELRLDEYGAPVYIYPTPSQIKGGVHECIIIRQKDDVRLSDIQIIFDECGNLALYILQRYPHSNKLPDFDEEVYTDAVNAYFAEILNDEQESELVVHFIMLCARYTEYGNAVEIEAHAGLGDEFFTAKFVYLYEHPEEIK
ncbi:MAG: hypothetical protein IJY88_07880 [Clostridia bacterium]|nr:hypothetical protein [Clostridia bacterium]